MMLQLYLMLSEGLTSISERNREVVTAEASRLFRTVRDVPYVLGVDGDPNKLFTDNLGNCTRKHLHLIPRLHALGYKITLGIAEFDWQDLPIPPDILQLLKDPIDSHLFLYASLDGNEMTVDATWDSGMPTGFFVNDWNGIDSSQISVPALRVRRENYHLLRGRVTLLTALSYLRPANDRPTPFNDAFNHWLSRKLPNLNLTPGVTL